MRQYVRRWLGPVMGVAIAGGAAVLLAGCGSDTTGVRQVTGASSYWALRLNHHAITMATVAPYDTLTLVATPVTVSGTSLSLDSARVLYSVNKSAVSVSPAGVVQVVSAQQVTQVQVIAMLTMRAGGQSVTRADTAYVNVLKSTAIPTVQRLILQGPDSGAIAMDSASAGTAFVTATVRDASNQAITPVLIHFSVPDDQTTLRVLNRNFDSFTSWSVGTPGHVVIHAEATVFGTTVSDSFPLTVGYPLFAEVDIDTSMARGRPAVKGFARDTLFIGQGGSVVWVNRLYDVANDSADVEFDNPADVQALNGVLSADFSLKVFGDGSEGAVLSEVVISPDGGGDIAPFFPEPPPVVTDTTQFYINFTYDNGKGRSFPTSGTYTYHSRFFPGTGAVRVIANSSLH